jgi:glycosyltransferase involved in cell wall biosynthesis
VTLSPLVSIAVPTRNRAVDLRENLENICGQDYPRLEILISDNCSTDDTEQVCRAAAAADTRIRYVRQARNIGVHGNHNFCMDEARGEFLCFFHDHDRRDSRFVSKHVAFLQRHPRVGVVGSDWDLVGDAGNQLGLRPFRGPSVSSGVEYTTRTIRSGRSSIGIPGATIRIAALGTTRFGLDAPIGFGDFAIWFRVAEEWDVGHISEPLSSWRQNAESFSARPIVEIARDYEKNIGEYCDDHLRRRRANADLVETWRTSLHRFLFWALAYEVALHFRRRGGNRTSHRARTMFEVMNYDLTPDQFEKALSEMRRHRFGVVEHAALATIQSLIQLRLTLPFGWIVRHHDAFRALLRLK